MYKKLTYKNFTFIIFTTRQKVVNKIGFDTVL